MKKSILRHITLLMIAVFMLNLSTSLIIASGNMSQTINIPKLGISSSIDNAPLTSQTWDTSHLNDTAGRLEAMPWFGSDANIPIVGHSTDLEGNPDIFYNLHLLEPNDEIIFWINGEEYRYIVDHLTTVSRYDTSILSQGDSSRVTLFTCTHGSYNEATNEFEERTVVVAYLAD